MDYEFVREDGEVAHGVVTVFWVESHGYSLIFLRREWQMMFDSPFLMAINIVVPRTGAGSSPAHGQASRAPGRVVQV